MYRKSNTENVTQAMMSGYLSAALEYSGPVMDIPNDEFIEDGADTLEDLKLTEDDFSLALKRKIKLRLQKFIDLIFENFPNEYPLLKEDYKEYTFGAKFYITHNKVNRETVSKIKPFQGDLAKLALRFPEITFGITEDGEIIEV